MRRFKLESYHGRSLEAGSKGYDGIIGAHENKTEEERIEYVLNCIPEDNDDDLYDLKEDDEKIIEEDFGKFAKKIADYPYNKPTAKDVINAGNEITGRDEVDNRSEI